MRSYKDYQSIPLEEDELYERTVDACFDELCDLYADEITEQGMNAYQKASLMERARKMALDRVSEN